MGDYDVQVRQINSAPKGHENGVPQTFAPAEFGFEEAGGGDDDFFSLVPTNGDISQLGGDSFTAHYSTGSGNPYSSGAGQDAQFSSSMASNLGAGVPQLDLPSQDYDNNGGGVYPKAAFSSRYQGKHRMLTPRPAFEHERALKPSLEGGAGKDVDVANTGFTTQEVVELQGNDERVEELERKIEKLKARLAEKNEAIKAREKDHLTEVEEMKTAYDELLEELTDVEKAAEMAAKEAQAAAFKRGGEILDVQNNKLFANKELKVGENGEILSDEEFTDEEEGYIPVVEKTGRVRAACRFACGLVPLCCSYVPLSMAFAIRVMEKNHGKNVGAFFRFHRFLVNLNLMLCLVWLLPVLYLVYNMGSNLDYTKVYQVSPSWTYPYWLLYSAWTTSIPEQLLVGFAASISTIAVGVFIVIKLVRQNIKYAKIEVRSSEYQSISFTKLLFTGYNHGMPSDIEHMWRVDQQRRGMIRKFKLLLQTSVVTANRRRGFLKCIVKTAWRSLVLVGYILWILAVWAILLGLIRAQQVVSSIYEFEKWAIPLFLWVINVVVRNFFPKFANREMWRSPYFWVWMSHFRVFILHLIHLLPILYYHYYIYKAGAIESTANTGLDFIFIFQSTSNAGSKGFTCPEDQIAVEYLRIIVVEILFWPWSRAFKCLWAWFIAVVRRRSVDRVDFNVSRESMHIAYLQILFILAIPYNPTISFLALVFFWVHFKYDEWFMLLGMERAFEHDMSAYMVLQNEIYLSVGFVLWLCFIMYWYLFYPAGNNRSDNACGPYAYDQNFVNRIRALITENLVAGASTLTLVWDDIVLNPVLAWIVVLFVGASNQINSIRSSLFRKQLYVVKAKADNRIADLVNKSSKGKTA